MSNTLILILIAIFAVMLSGLFAGAEIGIYQISWLRLRLGVEKKQFSFVVLGKIMRDSSALLLSMLIGNNLTHYLVASIVTFLLLSRMESPHTVELFATLITSPILFIFAELIPKNIFFYRADYLMPYFSPVLFVFHKAFSWSGAVPLLKFITVILARLTGASVPSRRVETFIQKRHIRTIFADTQEEGILSPIQADIINRLINISNIRIRSVMTPIDKVIMVDVNSDRSALLEKLKKYPFTRLLVKKSYSTNIIGFINIYETLCCPEQFSNLHNFIKPIRKLDANTKVIDAINTMQNENQEIALVTRTTRTRSERPAGIVTMKDLVEELLGELSEW